MKRISYLKINGVDFSPYTNELKINKSHNFNKQTNAAGDTVVDYINSKMEIEAGIIPISDSAMANLQKVLNSFTVTVEVLNPLTKQPITVKCIIPDNEVEYYTIRVNNTSFKGFSFTMIEL